MEMEKLKESTAAVEAYCVKCHEKREMKGAKQITMKNGKPAVVGSCPTCSTRMFRVGVK